MGKIKKQFKRNHKNRDTGKTAYVGGGTMLWNTLHRLQARKLREPHYVKRFDESVGMTAWYFPHNGEAHETNAPVPLTRAERDEVETYLVQEAMVK